MKSGEAVLRLMLIPLREWLDAPGVTEIVCQKPGEVGVEKAGRWSWHDVPSLTTDRLQGIATLAAAMSQQDVGPSQPLCASTLPDGQRIQICLPPVVETISLTIRRPPTFTPTLVGLGLQGLFATTRSMGALVNDNELQRLHAAGDWQRFFPLAVRSRKTIILGGDTGSGKTTIARALAGLIPENERLVTIEDTAELRLPHRNRVALFYSKGDQGLSRVRSEELIEAALRMRPDRILLGELRDGAAFTFVRSIAAGHPGSITTCHARSPEGAFTALSLMLKQHDAGKHLADADAMTMLRDSIDVIAHCEKRSDGSRGVSEVFLRSAS